MKFITKQFYKYFNFLSQFSNTIIISDNTLSISTQDTSIIVHVKHNFTNGTYNYHVTKDRTTLKICPKKEQLNSPTIQLPPVSFYDIPYDYAIFPQVISSLLLRHNTIYHLTLSSINTITKYIQKNSIEYTQVHFDGPTIYITMENIKYAQKLSTLANIFPAKDKYIFFSKTKYSTKSSG